MNQAQLQSVCDARVSIVTHALNESRNLEVVLPQSSPIHEVIVGPVSCRPRIDAEGLMWMRTRVS
jgi:hypothetical protein